MNYVEVFIETLNINKNSTWSKDIIEGLHLIISRIDRVIAESPKREG